MLFQPYNCVVNMYIILFAFRRLEQNLIKIIPPGAFTQYKKLKRM